MLELRHVRTRNFHQRLIALNNSLIDERLHTEMIVLDSKMLQVPPGKDKRAKVLINRLKQRLRRSQANARSVHSLVATVAVDAVVVSDTAFAGASEGLDGEDVSFFHSLIGLRFGEGNLLVAVDLVAEDVVAGEAADGFHGDCLAVQLDFVAFHCFLDNAADFVDAGVDSGFL